VPLVCGGVVDEAAELVAAGSTVILIGGAGIDGTLDIRSPAVHISGQLAHAVMLAEHFVSALASQSAARVDRR